MPITVEHLPFFLPEVTHREVGGVIEIASNPYGWPSADVRFDIQHENSLSGNPNGLLQELPPEATYLQQAWFYAQAERGPKGDFNGEKVAIHDVRLGSDGSLVALGGLVDYFTLWGLPGAAPTFHKQAISELTTSGNTEIPIGVSTHNMLIIGSGKERKLVMVVQSRAQGFSAGRISTSFEEQMEPEDGNSFATAAKGYEQELGVSISAEQITLLGVAVEKGAAYTSWAHIAEAVQLTEADVRRSWEKAKDKKEGVALLFVPLDAINETWISGNIPKAMWRKYDVDQIISAETLQLHATGAWRLTLLQEHFQVVDELVDNRASGIDYYPLDAEHGSYAIPVTIRGNSYELTLAGLVRMEIAGTPRETYGDWHTFAVSDISSDWGQIERFTGLNQRGVIQRFDDFEDERLRMATYF